MSKVGPATRAKLLQKNVGKNAAKEVQKVNPKPGQTVNVKQDPKTGSVSSTVTSKKTIGVVPSAGKSDTKSLVNPNKKQNVKNAKKTVKDFNKVGQREAEVTQKPTANTVTQSGGGSIIKTMPGSGKPIPKGADVTQKTTTNDQGQKVTRTTVKTSGSSTDGFAGQPDKKAQLIDVKNRRREIQGLPPLTGGTNSGSSSSSKTIGVDQSAGKSDTKSLVNPNKKQNVKNAKNLKKDFMKVDKEVSSMSIDKEPKAQVDVGKFSGPGGF